MMVKETKPTEVVFGQEFRRMLAGDFNVKLLS